MEPVLTDEVCAVVLAAGEGARLRPLTLRRPKPLCPVDNVPLVDLALQRLEGVTSAVAVNLHHGREALAAHLEDRPGPPIHLSIEEPEALGTAGALGLLRSWIDGRGTIVLNGDTWCPGSVAPVVEGWDGERVRLLVVGEDLLSPNSRLAGALMPWSEVSRFEPVPAGLYEASWRRLAEAGRIDVVRWDGPCVDCGTPARYLAANMAASGGAPVVGPDCKVDGLIERSVLWAGSEVAPDEHLVDAIRGDGQTIYVR